VLVRLFGREVHIPAGPFFLASRSDAPAMPAFCHWEAGRYHRWAGPRLEAPEGADRDRAVQELAQQWAGLFESFVREHPDMWQFWLDKRWARWLGVAG